MDSFRNRLASHPAFAAAEAVVFVGAILAFIWWLAPLGVVALDVLFYVAIVGMTILSHYLHHDTLRDIGFRLDNVGACARMAAAPTAILALGVIVPGLVRGSIRLDWGQLAIGLFTYPFWALVQQYALQGMVLLRLQDAGLRGRPAALAAAALFALVHMPNPGLVVMVFVSGWAWCEIFQRHPNLYVLAVSHGWLGTFAMLALPAIITGQLRIGPNYIAYFGNGWMP